MIRDRRAPLIVACAFLIAGCQLSPTKVVERQQREFSAVVEKAGRGLEIGESTVVLDARSAFDYGLNRVLNSIHFPWEKLAESAASGELARDPRKAALALSLVGLTPEKSVVIVGYGPKGRGEEGRLAWHLLHLGFDDVQVGSVELFRKRWTQMPTPQPENARTWEARPRADMIASPAEFHRWATDPKGRLEKRVFILDVRSPSEFLGKSADAKTRVNQNINAINIEWSEFYTSDGRPNLKMRRRLMAQGIEPGDHLIVISDRGVRSAAAAYALLAIGYRGTQNVAAGWTRL